MQSGDFRCRKCPRLETVALACEPERERTVQNGETISYVTKQAASPMLIANPPHCKMWHVMWRERELYTMVRPSVM